MNRNSFIRQLCKDFVFIIAFAGYAFWLYGIASIVFKPLPNVFGNELWFLALVVWVFFSIFITKAVSEQSTKLVTWSIFFPLTLVGGFIISYLQKYRPYQRTQKQNA